MNLCAGAGLKPGGQGVRGCVCRVEGGGAVTGVGGGKVRGGGIREAPGGLWPCLPEMKER